jgi:cysteinyl-tRNA synthetase
MPLHLTNTRSGAKEPFVPSGPEALLYVCGPTVYGEAHMGHARSYVIFDVLRRYLEYRGVRVRHVQNYTDIEDSITRRAREAGEDPLAYASRRIASFRREMDRLGVRPAHHYPRVTEHIPEIVAVVERLLATGWAYERDGNVYFRARRSRALGTLSHRDIAGALAGAADAGERDDVLDFAVWKVAKPGEPAWGSPWGRGRPGWHVECFAMGSKYLGTRLDLHGGGLDLIYPHHESEEMIAEAVTGEVWSRFWLHNGFLLLESAKMSKSLGNAAPLAPYLDEMGPDVLRLCLIKEHYRDSVEHDPVCFRISSEQVAGLRKVWEKLQRMGGGAATGKAEALVRHSTERIVGAMDDDLNTRDAVVALIEFAEAVKELPDVSADEARLLLETYRGFLSVFGLFGQ